MSAAADADMQMSLITLDLNAQTFEIRNHAIIHNLSPKCTLVEKTFRFNCAIEDGADGEMYQCTNKPMYQCTSNLPILRGLRTSCTNSQTQKILKFQQLADWHIDTGNFHSQIVYFCTGRNKFLNHTGRLRQP